MNRTLLDIGSGSINRSEFDELCPGTTVLHLDSSYDNKCATVSDMDQMLYEYRMADTNAVSHIVCGYDIFEFLDASSFKFNDIVANRIFEHMDYTSGEIGRLLEALNKSTFDDSTMSILVPNMIDIAQMLLLYEKSSNIDEIESARQRLVINTEAHNCKSDPHLSTWTPKMAKFYIESEGTWKIDIIESNVKFASRDIYMRLQCSKIV